MAVYEKKVYVKKNGKWQCVKCSFETAPHSKAFWEKQVGIEKKSNMGEKTYLVSRDNKVVSVATTYFGDREKVVRSLVNSSLMK